jgi:hypothetical protein
MLMPMRVGLPSHPYSFLIEKRGSLIVAQDSRGRIQYSGTDAASVIQSAINALGTDGGKIFIRRATYPLGAATLTVTFPSTDFELGIICEEGTIFTSSASKVIDVTNTAWVSGVSWLLKIENLKIEHTTSASTDVTLDLMYSQPILRNVRLTETGYTRQATAFKVGPTQGAGRPVSWIDCIATNYRIGFDLSLDHLTLIKPIANDCKDIAFWLHDMEWTALYSPDVWYTSAVYTTLKCFFVGHIGKGIRLYNVNVEGPSGYPLSNPIFNRDTSVSFWKKPEVFGFDAYPAGMTLDSASPTYVKIHAARGEYLTENNGTATFSGTGSQTQFTIPHGLAGTPKVAVVTAGSSDAKGDFYVTYDNTNIYVTYATAPPSGTNNVVLYWYAEM